MQKFTQWCVISWPFLYFRDHQAALSRLEEQCRQEMEKHKQVLDREYEHLLTQFSRELERLQLKHQEELEKVTISRKNYFPPVPL